MESSPATIEEAAECVRAAKRLQIVGNSTKPALARPIDGADRLRTSLLRGVTDYQPDEFLVTALAGTTLGDLDTALASRGQYLPFNPPLAGRGATLGGTVAANLSGPGRLRHGGLRDFLMGVRLIDGLGEIVTGGGRVVKNAAGYDLPKLVAGSCGLWTLIVEVTLKVFPRPAHRLGLRRACDSLANAMQLCFQLSQSRLDLTAIEVGSNASVDVLLSGSPSATELTHKRLVELTDDSWSVHETMDVWQAWDDWSDVQPGERLTRVAIAPSLVTMIDASFAELCVPRRYSAAGNVAWIRWPSEKPIRILDETLSHHRVGGTILTGSAPQCRIGRRPSASLLSKIQTAFDPQQRFVGPP